MEAIHKTNVSDTEFNYDTKWSYLNHATADVACNAVFRYVYSGVRANELLCSSFAIFPFEKWMQYSEFENNKTEPNIKIYALFSF